MIRLVTEKLMEKNLDMPGIILEMSILLTDKYPLQLASEYGEKNVSLIFYSKIILFDIYFFKRNLLTFCQLRNDSRINTLEVVHLRKSYIS